MAGRRGWTIGIALLVSGGFAACSGKTEQASGTSTSGTSGNGDGTYTVGCPATPPSVRTTANGAKSPCSVEGQICEYGTDFDPRCNTIVQCSSGEWGIPILGSGGGVKKECGAPAPTLPPNPAECPATRAAVVDGQACSATSACAYDGSTCTCGVFCPSFPVGQRDCDADAGVTTNCCDRSKAPTWHCFDGPKRCPSPRPHIGDPCTNKEDSCAIGPPSECGQTILACNGKNWEMPRNECPASTEKAKREIAYVTQRDARALRDDLLRVQLATYRYKSDSSHHLGFIIEDMPPGSPAVLESRDHVDLYGYVSMAVAAIQVQQAQIEKLESELAETKRSCKK
ncbi:MAG: hypothetical protein JST00_41875 [Deltaproteobacteria bacterium]|nr:hypothetical protein [Deltaproteobacteria bacterium]